MGLNDMMLAIAGEIGRNSNGSSRQDEIARCLPGEQVTFRIEPESWRLSVGIAVDSARGVQIGYVKYGYSRWFAEQLTKARRVRAIVEGVLAWGPGRPSRVVLIRVDFDDEDIVRSMVLLPPPLAALPLKHRNGASARRSSLQPPHRRFGMSARRLLPALARP